MTVLDRDPCVTDHLEELCIGRESVIRYADDQHVSEKDSGKGAHGDSHLTPPTHVQDARGRCFSNNAKFLLKDHLNQGKLNIGKENVNWSKQT